MKHINNFFIKEPVWRELKQWPLHSLPSQVSDWLLESGSLTRRMKESFQAPFGVQLIEQGLARPTLADAQCLKQRPQHIALIREVQLSIAGRPFVFARTTLPRSVAQGLQELTHLGTKPLGEVIFNYPELKRLRLDLAKIGYGQLNPQTQPLLKGHSHLWARRNTYQINQHEFLVSEFFLPALFKENDISIKKRKY